MVRRVGAQRGASVRWSFNAKGWGRISGENGGSLELWVKENGTFRRGTIEEETWREEFLKDVIGD